MMDGRLILGNAGVKRPEEEMSYELLQQRGYTWKLVYDPKFTAARRCTAKGVSVLDDMPPDEAEENEEPDEVIDLDPDPAQKNPDLEKMIRTYMP